MTFCVVISFEGEVLYVKILQFDKLKQVPTHANQHLSQAVFRLTVDFQRCTFVEQSC